MLSTIELMKGDTNAYETRATARISLGICDLEICDRGLACRIAPAFPPARVVSHHSLWQGQDDVKGQYKQAGRSSSHQDGLSSHPCICKQ
jgi:hypothetical protein